MDSNTDLFSDNSHKEKWVPAILNGSSKETRGSVIHAVPDIDLFDDQYSVVPALCGREPGLGIGWLRNSRKAITCPICIKEILMQSGKKT